MTTKYNFEEKADEISWILANSLAPKFRSETKNRPKSQIANGPQIDRLTTTEKKALDNFLHKMREEKKRGGLGIKETVTPTLAVALLLALNWRNPRKVNMTTVNTYSKAMVDGEWYSGSTTIGVEEEDFQYITNGQHRLMAAEMSRANPVLFFSIVHPKSIPTEDCGQPRTLAFRLEEDGPTCKAVRTLNEMLTGSRDRKQGYVIKNIIREYQPDIDYVLGRPKILKGAGIIDIKPPRTIIFSTLIWLRGQVANNKTFKAEMDIFIDEILCMRRLQEDGSTPAADVKSISYQTHSHIWKIMNTLGQGASNTVVFHTICRSAYHVLHKLPMSKVKPDETSVDFFSNLNMDKLECFSTTV